MVLKLLWKIMFLKNAVQKYQSLWIPMYEAPSQTVAVETPCWASRWVYIWWRTSRLPERNQKTLADNNFYISPIITYFYYMNKRDSKHRMTKVVRFRVKLYNNRNQTGPHLPSLCVCGGASGRLWLQQCSGFSPVWKQPEPWSLSQCVKLKKEKKNQTI